MTAGILGRVAVIVWAVVVWNALWSDLSVANVLWGAAAGALGLWVLPVRPWGRRHRVRPVGVLVYFAHAAWLLVKASGVVAWEVVTPGSRINQGIVEVPLRNRSMGLTTLIANTVSLTPGTLTLEVRREPPALYVHILHLRTIEDVRDEIGRLEELALRAFPPVVASTVESPPAEEPS